MANYLDQLYEAIVASDAPKMATNLILHTLGLGASDIHVEPSETNVRIRTRVDGTLHQVTEYPLNLHESFIARIKIMSGLKTDETRLPQDGVISMTIDGGGSVDLRVSTMPTVEGEKVVMRIQDKTKEVPTFKEMGIRGGGLERFEDGINKPNGIILVTGPTGSGKTTTLYSALRILNQEGVNIITVEDPVEYQMQGLNQCQIKHDIGFDFARGLRASLRQDPDIIMVGEIRDAETIEIALRAAMTGHLVLSTIHTNSAVATLNRITDMGIKPFLIAAAVKCIQAQRLVRKVCSSCAKKYKPAAPLKKEILKELETIPASEGIDLKKIKDNMTLVKGQGCDKCHNTGYKGRMGIFEVLTVDRDVEQMIVKGSTEIEVLDYVKKEKGFVTLMQDGLIKALAGLTTVDEVFEIANAD